MREFILRFIAMRVVMRFRLRALVAVQMATGPVGGGAEPVGGGAEPVGVLVRSAVSVVSRRGDRGAL